MPDLLSPSTPGSLTGPNLVLAHLSFFYAQLQAPTPSEDADAERLLALMLLYSLRATTGIHPPPSSFGNFLKGLEDVIEVTLGPGYLLETRKILMRHLEEHSQRIMEPASGLRELAMGIDSVIITDNEDVAVLRGIQRRSPLGVLLRRIRLNIWRTDDVGLKTCAEAFGRWYKADRDRQTHAESSFAGLGRRERGQSNDRLQSYLLYQHALRTGDYSSAMRHRFRFFDFFPQGSTKVLYQRTLLDLAHFYVHTKGIASARAALKEAIHIARSAEDRECIVACDSLMRRMEPEEHKAKARQTRETSSEGTSDVRSTAHTSRIPSSNEWANDRLVEVLQALEAGISVNAAFWALVRPPKRPETMEVLEGISSRAHRRDAVVARLWNTMGAARVATVHRETAVVGSAYPDQPNREEALLETRIEGAETEALQGRYEDALAFLVDARVIRGLNASLFPRWHRAVLSVLWIRARRAGDTKTISELEALDGELEGVMEGLEDDGWEETRKRTVSSRGQRRECGSATTMPWRSERTGLLGLRRSASKLLDADEPAQALEPLAYLLALTAEKRHCSLRLDAIVLLGEAILSGPRMPKLALEILEDVMPELLNDVDVERRGLARCTYARALLGARSERREQHRADAKTARTLDERDVEDAEHALNWLRDAGKDLWQVSSLPSLSRVLWHQSHLLAELSRGEERDSAAERFAEVQRRMAAMKERAGKDELVVEVESLLFAVGERVSVGF